MSGAAKPLLKSASLLKRLRVDPYILVIIAVVGLASLLPARGAGAAVFDHATSIAIALLFFLYGTRLSAQAALDGLRHWRLHLLVLACTFVLFPLLGLLFRPLVGSLLTMPLYLGVVFLCTLPSTVQSSIAFTSIARGNVAAAICGASFSNLFGIVLTPLLVSLLLSTHGSGLSLGAIRDIVLQLLAPFLVGQVLRRWIGDWVRRNQFVLDYFDRGSILLVVYSAFSAGVTAGIWQQIRWPNLLTLLVVNGVLLTLVLFLSGFLARRLGFCAADRITIVFCGSKKSLASGLPMASVLFAPASVGLIVLPLMLFHQMQLMACAALARRWAARPDEQTGAVGVARASGS